MRCAKQSTDTKKESVPVTPEEVNMKRAVINCNHCGKKNVLTEANCVLHLFTRQPAFSWCEVLCKKCEAPLDFFFDPIEWIDHLKTVFDSGVGVIEEEWIDQTTYEQYLDVWGQHLVVHELTPHQDKEIAFFRYLMDVDPVERWFDE